MILPFSLQLNGQETLFVEKITQGLYQSEYVSEEVKKAMLEYSWPKNEYYQHPWSCRNDLHDKIHTFRKDEKNRWKPGTNIHMAVNNRTRKFWQFAPVIPCVSTQQVNIIHTRVRIQIYIDFKCYCEVFKDKTYSDSSNLKKLQKLAENDGFETWNRFLKYFNTDFSGKIIHWTNFKY